MTQPHQQDADGLLPQVNARVQQSGVYGGTRVGTVIKSGPNAFTVKWDIRTVAYTYNRDALKSDQQCPITVLAAPPRAGDIDTLAEIWRICDRAGEYSKSRLATAIARIVEGRTKARAAAPPKPAPDAMRLDVETIQTLLDLLNPLHGGLDYQIHINSEGEHVYDAPPDYEHSVIVLAQQERDLTQAVLILEDRKRAAPVPSPDGAGETKKKFKCPHCGEISNIEHDGACGVW